MTATQHQYIDHTIKFFLSIVFVVIIGLVVSLCQAVNVLQQNRAIYQQVMGNVELAALDWVAHQTDKERAREVFQGYYNCMDSERFSVDQCLLVAGDKSFTESVNVAISHSDF